MLFPPLVIVVVDAGAALAKDTGLSVELIKSNISKLIWLKALDPQATTVFFHDDGVIFEEGVKWLVAPLFPAARLSVKSSVTPTSDALVFTLVLAVIPYKVAKICPYID